MIHLAKRVIRQTINDKRSVMMILIAPLLILTLAYFLLGDSGLYRQLELIRMLCQVFS